MAATECKLQYRYSGTAIMYRYIFKYCFFQHIFKYCLFPAPLPAADVESSVSLEQAAPSVTITFKVNIATSKLCMVTLCIHIWLPMQTVQVNFTGCSLQWPEKYTLAVKKQGTNPTETIQSVEQTVMGMENEYALENLDFRQKYQVSIKLGKSSSSSIPVIANICE